MNFSFTEEDIRPIEFDKGKEEAQKKDLKRLISKKQEFIEVVCPACCTQSHKFAFKKYSFSFVQCDNCYTVYMNPRAPSEVLKDFYANSELYAYWNKYIFPASQEIRRENIFKPRVTRIIDICKKYDISTNCVIEIGAGFGTFCEEIQKTGIFNRVIAVELGLDLAKHCRSLGLEVFENSIEEINNLDVQASVIASFEVIEHLFSPEEFLLNCKQLMEPNSIIIVTCPNYKGFDIETLGIESESIDAEHINLFNPYSISMMFERCGFSVLECTTPGELDVQIVRNKVLNGHYNIENQPFLKTVLIDCWQELGAPFQQFLKQNKLSSNLLLIAKNIY